jgi:hypothetical protein
VLEPADVKLTPQLLRTETAAAVLRILSRTGSAETTPAPWWPNSSEASAATRTAWREAGSTLEDDTTGGTGSTADAAVAPFLRMLGPVDLQHAAGSPPARAARQCLEYCGWLLAHPGATAREMASGLLVAESTRRSNMSRLRSWLGVDPEGRPYLPDAYSGHIRLAPAVSSDWAQLQLILAPGLPASTSRALRTALELVRGAPLADAAPGQWHWAEEMRTDMVSMVRDIGVELTSRALADHDVTLARWAASRALAAAPGDELLLRARISTEHQAGNAAEVERLCSQLFAQARALGMDLEPETVTLLQELMEGQVRARLG